VHAEKCINIVANSNTKKSQTYRQKNLERRIECAYFENDQEESNPIPHHTDMAFTYALRRMNGNIRYRKTSPEETHGDGGRIGKTIR
jgi:hypothetical protein